VNLVFGSRLGRNRPDRSHDEGLQEIGRLFFPEELDEIPDG
jgi:hypothetical protein